MEYTKPVVLAQNAKQNTFAAGCPPQENRNNPHACKPCERTS